MRLKWSSATRRAVLVRYSVRLRELRHTYHVFHKVKGLTCDSRRLFINTTNSPPTPISYVLLRVQDQDYEVGFEFSSLVLSTTGSETPSYERGTATDCPHLFQSPSHILPPCIHAYNLLATTTTFAFIFSIRPTIAPARWTRMRQSRGRTP